MNLTNVFEDELNGVATDFRAEVIAAEMIENNTPAERVLIVPLGAMNRPQNKDIESVITEVSGYDNKEYILIRTHKEGLYDKLPEGLFHNPISYANDKSEQQVIDGIRLHRVEEKTARLFFLPFDAALFSARVQIALYENQLDKKFHNNQLINIFSPHWQIFQHLNVLQSNIFLQFLPLIHSIRDDWQAIETLLELMFLSPAKLKLRSLKKPAQTGIKKNNAQSEIGKGSLGIDLTTGHPIDGGGFDEMVITFGPITAERVSAFTQKAGQEGIVRMLCDYLVPADLDIAIEYDLVESERSFLLPHNQQTTDNCSMGVSTYL